MSAVVLPLAALGMLVTKQRQIAHKTASKQSGRKEKETKKKNKLYLRLGTKI